jgi:DNA-binding NarL/FixJ family response regulator
VPGTLWYYGVRSSHRYRSRFGVGIADTVLRGFYYQRMPTNVKVLIAEEHLLMAQCLQKLLEAEFENVEIMEEGRDLFDSVASFRPDVILLDSRLAHLNGIKPATHFPKLAAVSKVIVITGHAEPAHVAEAFRAGVSGYVLKRCTCSEFTQAIWQVIHGRTNIKQLVSQRAVTDALTPRQLEVLHLVAQGSTAKEIANQLKLSVKTAVFHKTSIMDRLGLRTIAELTRYAIENDILPTNWRRPAHAELNAETFGPLAAAAAS